MIQLIYFKKIVKIYEKNVCFTISKKMLVVDDLGCYKIVGLS